jgi:type VI secretion system secreted protein VgrG
MTALQTSRHIAITTPLGEDVLLLQRMTGTEELGRMFCFEVDLLSRDPNIKFEKILGQKVTIRINLPKNKERYFNGYISRFSQMGTSGIYHAYHATVHPWLWFLTRTADCRIFQNKTVPDIIKEVLKEQGFTDIKDALGGIQYRTWEYCVQYRETDFNFISRLMEQEGIYYFFTHEQNKHTLVLANTVSSHEPFPTYEQITYYPPENEQHREEEHIFDWSLSQEVQPGIYALNDYDFKQPKANLLVKSAISRKHDRATMEIFDYPGEYVTSAEGEAYVRSRVEELQTKFERAHGQANARGIAVGSTFMLQGYPRTDQNREYLVVSATHILSSDAFDSTPSAGDGKMYSCTFSAMHIQEVFRPARLTPRPIVQGPQTAVVVGPSGEEIYTDKYGRVKVQFHWDRYGKADETSSCWMRVGQLWAGNGWGSMHIPRIGQEVIVDFLEGDPDQPLVTGSVYRGSNMPPYTLPDEMTKSTIKSNSTKGGGGFNEIRFEDKKGSEQIFIHGEKDLDLRIKNDCKQYIGNERHLTVENDQFANLKKTNHLTVTEDYFEKVDGDVNITVGGDRAAKLTGNEHLTVGKDLSIKTGTDSNIKSGGAHNHETGQNYSVKSGMDIHQKAGMNIGMEGGMAIHIKGGMNVVIEAGMQLSLKAGASFIDIGPAGVSISGTPLVNINSGGATGNGGGCSPASPALPDPPDPPKEAKLPVEAKAGKSDEAPAGRQYKKEPGKTASTMETPQAQAMKEAAENGTPFCDT